MTTVGYDSTNRPSGRFKHKFMLCQASKWVDVGHVQSAQPEIKRQLSQRQDGSKNPYPLDIAVLVNCFAVFISAPIDC
jgi:hypothetical protein